MRVDRSLTDIRGVLTWKRLGHARRLGAKEAFVTGE
jgi:hypothetical protein